MTRLGFQVSITSQYLWSFLNKIEVRNESEREAEGEGGYMVTFLVFVVHLHLFLSLQLKFTVSSADSDRVLDRLLWLGFGRIPETSIRYLSSVMSEHCYMFTH